MSELKRHHINEVMDMHNLTRGKMGYSFVYYTDDVDKVIAELKQKTNEVQTELELWRDGSIISEEHQKELDGKRHSDYKRCLAMAKWCESEVYNIMRTPLCDMDEHEGWQHDDDFWQRWYRRWLELAEKFKEAK